MTIDILLIIIMTTIVITITIITIIVTSSTATVTSKRSPSRVTEWITSHSLYPASLSFLLYHRSCTVIAAENPSKENETKVHVCLGGRRRKGKKKSVHG